MPRNSTVSDPRFEHALLEALDAEAPVGLAVLDAELRHTRVNDALCRMMQLTSEEILGRTPVDLHGPAVDEAEQLYRRLLTTGERATIEITAAVGADPEVPRHWRLNMFPVKVDDTPVALCILVEDITDRRSLEERLAHLAYHDQLTGLPNRTLVAEHLGRLLSRRPPAPRLGVLFVDVDRFKEINDVYGHAAGDAVLKAIASRLPQVIRPSDVAGRWGGDEFILLVDDVDGAALDALSQRVRREVAAPIGLGGTTIATTLSVGVTLARPGEAASLVLERADAAMYARKQGRAGAGPAGKR